MFINYIKLNMFHHFYLLFNESYINKSLSLSLYVLLCTHPGTTNVTVNPDKLDVFPLRTLLHEWIAF